MKRVWFIFYFATFLLFYNNASSQEKYLDSLFNWLQKHPEIDSQYIVTLHRISYRTSESDVKTSFEYYEKVQSLSEELQFTYGRSLAQINLGILLSNSANYESSNDAYFRALEFAKLAKAPRLESICLNNIGDNFFSLKNYDKCRQYTTSAIAINERLEAWRGVAINYELLHQCDLAEGLYKSAHQKLDTGFHYALLSNEEYILATYYLGYGKLAALSNDMEQARHFFIKAMQEAKVQNDLRNQYSVYIARVEYLKELSEGLKIAYLDSAYRIATYTNFLEGVGHSANLLSNVYGEMMNKDSSNKYFQIYRQAFDSVFSETNKRNVIIKESDWLIRQKEMENRHLQEIAEIQKKELGFKNILILSILGLFLLAGLAAVFVYKSIQSARKKQKSDLERKIIKVRMESMQAQMNPHFIFNTLNSIENFIVHNNTRDASRFLNKFASLMRIILDSSRLDSVPLEVDLQATQKYVELEQMRFNDKFKLISEIDPNLLSHKYMVPPLAIRPYVENAIIHGLAPSEKDGLFLKISVFTKNGYLYYTVEDNGIGRQKSDEYQKEGKLNSHKNYGTRLTEEKINIYSRQNKTTADILVTDLMEDGVPSGTRVSLRIKIN